jgi:hypothetical protein
MMHEKAVRTFGIVSIGMICGGIAACAGGDTPALDEDATNKIASVYAGGAGPVGAAGSGGKAATGTGGGKATGTAGKAATGTGGTASTSTAGSGGSGTAAGGSGTAAGGSGTAMGGSASGGGCDGYAGLMAHCSGGGCHGSGSGVSGFAESEDVAKTFIGKEGVTQCAGKGALLNPDNAASSMVVLKIKGSAPCGSPMPLGQPALADSDIQCVEDWISGLQ